MLAVQNEFKARMAEVDRYFQFLHDFDQNLVTVSAGIHGQPPMTASEKSELFKTLKANGFLLLYNLTEATLRNAIEAIFDEFKTQGVSFDDCRREVRHIVLKNLKQHNVGELLPKLSTISVDLVVTTFRKDKLFFGNVDGRRIRKIADEYGFLRPSKRSAELLTVKTNRNDLAHGNKSFAEVGRDFDVNRLQAIKGEVEAFIDEAIVNIADYIATRAYLSNP